ncbi:unnamed protein product [Rotaria sp. Silwood2]|nr:unnamed protein product [Rotaria sp. Silwood2]CAF4353836.1 unnamed protein product [Rotaria sp. Silwood2]
MVQNSQRNPVTTALNTKLFHRVTLSIATNASDNGLQSESSIGYQERSKILVPYRWANSLSLSQALGSATVPIHDVHDVYSASYSKCEQVLRCKLASLYRIIDLFGWSQGIYNHVTVCCLSISEIYSTV